MAKNTSILIGEHFQEMISQEVSSGRYHSSSEVIREALRLFEDEKRRRNSLDSLLKDGESSGVAKDFDFDSFKKEMRAKHAS